jgi:hypothetical protein
MSDARSRLRVEEVAGGGLEELEHGRVLERRRVRHVHNDRGTLEHPGQALAGERVDARVRGGRDGFVAAVAADLY